MSSYTIDDSEWNTSRISLSPGWNMIGPIASDDRFLNSTEVERMRPMLGQFSGGTVSWTTAKYSSNQILFNGTGIDVFGLAGPAQGVFSAVLDDKLLGAFNAYNDVDKPYLLLSNKGLSNGMHNLTMINLEEGKAFTFDYAVAQTGSGSAISSPASSSASSPAISFPSTSSASGLAASQTTGSLSPSTTARYTFSWSPIFIFVLSFGSLLFLLSLLGALYYFLIVRRRASKPEFGQAPTQKAKRRRTLMEALRGRKIGPPVPVKEPTLRDFRLDSDGSLRNAGGANVKREDRWEEDVEKV